MTVERFSHVMHIVSTLRGRLREDVDCLDALMACFPAGTVSGAPKSAPWKLSKNWSAPVAAFTPAACCTWILL